ncbi:MAG: putative potassium efflux system [Myxococcaceae bacterium]|nr:putative potassium efflux system [Myxococcaceae bacterium]
MFFPALRQFLSTPLITLSGGAITPGSLIVGGLVIIGSVALARFVGRWIRRILAARGHSQGAQFAVAKIVGYSIILIGTLSAVSSMGLKLDAVLAASAVLLVGIGFGLQNIAQNFISGIILLIEQPVSKGDFIKVREALGEVDDIGLRATTIITRDEVTIIVPNSELITEAVVNHSRPTHNLRVKIDVTVAYGSDTQQVKEILLRIAKAEPRVLLTPAPEVRLDAFADSALLFALLVWIGSPKDDLRIASAIRFEVYNAFREAKIEIPFPQRELRLRDPARG